MNGMTDKQVSGFQKAVNQQLDGISYTFEDASSILQWIFPNGIRSGDKWESASLPLKNRYQIADYVAQKTMVKGAKCEKKVGAMHDV